MDAINIYPNFIVVKRINQCDESSSLRLRMQIQLRYIFDDDSVEELRNLDVIAGGQWLSAEKKKEFNFLSAQQNFGPILGDDLELTDNRFTMRWTKKSLKVNNNYQSVAKNCENIKY